MARTTGIKKQIVPAYHEIDYRGYKIRKYDNSKYFTVEPDGNEIEVQDKEEAIIGIDKALDTPKKSRRTTGKQRPTETEHHEPEGPNAGWMKHPPISCKYKRIDEKKNYWVDVLLCVECADKFCTTYIKLIDPIRRKEVMQAQNYHMLSDKCPHCESFVIKDENVYRETWEYSCGSTGNRKNGTYDLSCKIPKTKSRRTT